MRSSIVVPLGLLRLTLACLLTGCSDARRTPIQPDRAVNSLTVESVSANISSGDYRTYFVRIRVRETSGAPIAISQVALQFLGDGPSVTRTFSNISKGIVSANASVELDDLAVADELRQVDSARSIVATITYRLPAGETGAAVGGGAVPNCANHFAVWGPDLIAVAESARMSAGLETGCSPMYYPVNVFSIQWQSLNPDVASVDSSGVITGVANGLATIQATYGRIVASHKLRVGAFLIAPVSLRA